MICCSTITPLAHSMPWERASSTTSIAFRGCLIARNVGAGLGVRWHRRPADQAGAGLAVDPDVGGGGDTKMSLLWHCAKERLSCSSIVAAFQYVSGNPARRRPIVFLHKLGPLIRSQIFSETEKYKDGWDQLPAGGHLNDVPSRCAPQKRRWRRPIRKPGWASGLRRSICSAWTSASSYPWRKSKRGPALSIWNPGEVEAMGAAKLLRCNRRVAEPNIDPTLAIPGAREIRIEFYGPIDQSLRRRRSRSMFATAQPACANATPSSSPTRETICQSRMISSLSLSTSSAKPQPTRRQARHRHPVG